MSAPRPRDARGQASVLALGLIVLAVGLLGLAWDGTRLLVGRRQAQSAADAAALAAAGGLDQEWIDLGGFAPPEIDASLAIERAEESLGASGVEGVVEADPGRVSVRAEVTVAFDFLAFFGFGARTVAATATAEPRTSAGA